MTRFIFLHGVGSTGAAMRPLAESLGVTATARASFAFYNTFEEVDALVDAVKAAREMLA